MSRFLILLLAAALTTALCGSFLSADHKDVSVTLTPRPGAGRLQTGWGGMGPASDPVNGQWDLTDETVEGIPDTLSDLHVRFIDFQWQTLLYDAYLAGRIDSAEYETYRDPKLKAVKPPEGFDEHVHYAVGRDTSGSFVIVFDTDNDESLADETSVTFPWKGPGTDPREFFQSNLSSRDYLRLFGNMPRFMVSRQLFDGNQILDSRLALAIAPYFVEQRRLSRDSPPVTTPQYLIGAYQNMVGTTTLGDSVFTFWVGGSPLGTYPKQEARVWFERGDQREAPIDSTDPFVPEPYLIGQVIEAGGRFYRLDDVSIDGTTLHLVEVDGKPGVGIRGGMQAPNLKRTTIDGRQLDLAAYRGKYVLLDFWSTTCGPCLAGLPDLKSVYTSFSRDDFEIVGIAQDDSKWLGQFVSDNGIEWPQITQNRSEDGAADILDAYRVTGIPAYFLIDPEGRVVDPTLGIYPHELGETLRKLMN